MNREPASDKRGQSPDGEGSVVGEVMPEAQLLRVQEIIVGNDFFGPEVFEEFYAASELEVPYPGEDAFSVLMSDCPFEPGKQVKDTHMLFLLPETINDAEFNLPEIILLLNEGTVSPATPGVFADENRMHSFTPLCGDMEPARWVLLYKGVLPGSSVEDEVKQVRLLQSYPEYEHASVRAVALGLALDKLTNGYREDRPEVSGKCAEIDATTGTNLKLSSSNTRPITIKAGTELSSPVGLFVSRRL